MSTLVKLLPAPIVVGNCVSLSWPGSDPSVGVVSVVKVLPSVNSKTEWPVKFKTGFGTGMLYS